MSRQKRSKKNPYKGDRFTSKAKDEGYMARSVYKLTEIDRRFRVFKQGQRVIDLGCYPGSWSQYVLQRVGGRGRLVGVDLSKPALPKGHFLAQSVFDVTAEELIEALGGEADVLVSDMAPKTSGVPHSDHVRQMELVRKALELANETLKPGGAFVVKIFDGEEVPAFQKLVKETFGKTRRIRPEAVRQVSREFFLLATEFKGRPEAVQGEEEGAEG